MFVHTTWVFRVLQENNVPRVTFPGLAQGTVTFDAVDMVTGVACFGHLRVQASVALCILDQLAFLIRPVS